LKALSEKKGPLWVYGTVYWLFMTKPKQHLRWYQATTAVDRGIIYDHIYTMLEDREQNLWAVTGNMVCFVAIPRNNTLVM
jgi:hypothetical protein